MFHAMYRNVYWECKNGLFRHNVLTKRWCILTFIKAHVLRHFWLYMFFQQNIHTWCRHQCITVHFVGRSMVAIWCFNRLLIPCRHSDDTAGSHGYVGRTASHVMVLCRLCGKMVNTRYTTIENRTLLNENFWIYKEHQPMGCHWWYLSIGLDNGLAAIRRQGII